MKKIYVIASLAYFILTMIVGFWVPRTDFYLTVTLFTFLFSLQYVLRNMEFLWVLILGFFVRFILCFSIPALSDDFYRFIWDGILNIKGINPYFYKPSELIAQFPSLRFLYEDLNSPDYYSVYPSINQYIYSIGVLVGRGSLYWSTVVMKLLMLGAECVTVYAFIFLCKGLAINKQNIIWYVLNPLVVLEFCGNLHFEGFMILSLIHI